EGSGADLVVADRDGIAIDRHVEGKAAVDAVVSQQMRIGFHRAEVIDGYDVNVLAAAFKDGAQDVAANAAESIVGNSDSHISLPWGRGSRCGSSIEVPAFYRRSAEESSRGINELNRFTGPEVGPQERPRMATPWRIILDAGVPLRLWLPLRL